MMVLSINEKHIRERGRQPPITAQMFVTKCRKEMCSSFKVTFRFVNNIMSLNFRSVMMKKNQPRQRQFFCKP